jgi:hypothetical protein
MCTVCDYKNSSEYSALGHEFINNDKYVVVVPATCTSVGSVNIQCVRCDELKLVETIAPVKHRLFIVADAIVPGCETPGHTVVTRCMDCSYEDLGTVIPATGHTIDDEGNCTACGAKNYDGDKYCTCLCHNTSFFMRIIYKIVRFFWKLLKMKPDCGCGVEHY